MGKICGTVEKSVEKLWERCVNHVGKCGVFPPKESASSGRSVEKMGLYTFFMIFCGNISTSAVNKIFVFNREIKSRSRSFPQFPHSLLLQLLNNI